jgi:hypothetical protein
MQRIAAGDIDWGEMYAQMSGRESAAFRTLFELAATNQHTPLVFHCTGGRDRTGVAAALLLSVLGVADGDIAHDYALTGVLLRPHVHRFRRHMEMFGMDEQRWTQLVDTDGDAMLQYLARLRRDHGSRRRIWAPSACAKKRWWRCGRACWGTESDVPAVAQHRLDRPVRVLQRGAGPFAVQLHRLYLLAGAGEGDDVGEKVVAALRQLDTQVLRNHLQLAGEPVESRLQFFERGHGHLQVAASVAD